MARRKLKDYQVPCGDCGEAMQFSMLKKRWECVPCELKELRSGYGKPNKYSRRESSG